MRTFKTGLYPSEDVRKRNQIDEIRERTTIDTSFDISRLNVVNALDFLELV